MNIYLEVILRVLGVIGLSVLSAILYRLGGSSVSDMDLEFPCIPSWFKRIPKKRDVLANICKLVACYLMLVCSMSWWLFGCFFLSWGLLWASLSTYWDELFGYDNHYMHGFMCQFSLLPIVIFSGYYVAFAIQCLLLCLAMGIYSGYEGNATKEELGRGFFLTIIELLKF